MSKISFAQSRKDPCVDVEHATGAHSDGRIEWGKKLFKRRFGSMIIIRIYGLHNNVILNLD